MAVLNKIRQRSLFLILVIALALFSFVLADLFKNSDALTSKSQNVIASVNGKDLTREDFMLKVENMQRQLGPNATNTQAMNRVWDAEVRNAIMQEQYDKLGITIEKDQMRDILRNALQSNPNFQNADGIYDEAKLNEYIANIKSTSPVAYQQWVDYENNLANNAMQQSYFNMIKAGVSGTIAEGKLDFELDNNKVDLKYVQVPFSSIPDSTITVTDAEVESYIRANPKQYEVEASRNINFIEFKEEASLEDEEAIKANLIKLLNGEKDNPTTNEVDESVVGFKDTTNDADFVNANSDIKFNDKFLYRSEMPTNIVDSIFDLNKGETFGPYKQDPFYMITKVVEEKQMPDSAKVRHILIPYVGGQRAAADVTKTPAQAKATADSILNIVKTTPKTVKDLLDLSSDKVSNEKDGIIDWFTPQSGLAQEFKDFSFENKKGDIDVVETSFGYHIIEIVDQKNYQRVIKIANLAQQIEASEKTINNVFNEVSKFEIAANEGSFQDIAKEKNYTVRPVNTIKSLDENIPGLGSQRQIVRWAFEDGTDVGDIKRFNLSNGGYAVVQLSAKNKKGLMSIQQASVTALPVLRNQKKAKMIMDRISATSIDEIAKAEGQTVKTANALTMKNPTIAGAGKEPKVIGTAFGLQEGATSGLIEGEKGVYVIEVTKVTPATAAENAYQAAANRLGNTKSGAVNGKLYNALKEAADIEDNRAEHF